jgi:ribosomal protein L37AE/L43A
MARNVVQFQKGLSEPAFEQHYGTEEQCQAIVVAARWPRDLECPVCGGKQYSLVTTRNLYQCTKCHRQTSRPIAIPSPRTSAHLFSPGHRAALL